MEKPENKCFMKKTEKSRNWNGPWIMTKKIKQYTFQNPAQEKFDIYCRTCR